MSLLVARRLFVVTPDGEREIQLCFGDITKLPVEDKVDVILISAFMGDYAAVSGTLIGALYHNLKLSVKELSYDRRADLRKNFHCWLSRDLPSHLPFRQLVCFEKSHRDSVGFVEAVAQVFRAMMPVFNNCNKSVITPLLACGNQGFSEAAMLQALLRAAVDWILAGLPLQLLKIVIYTRSPEKLGSSDLEKIEIFKKFEESTKQLKTSPLDVEIRSDVFLIYAEADQELANQVRAFLHGAKKRFKKSVVIVTVADIAKETASWQHDVVTAMVESGSVVALLTSSFLAENLCIDQFNLALCADRRTRRNLLTPVIFVDMAEIPEYMRSVQWFNCKSRDPAKIKEVCEGVICKRSGFEKSGTLPTYDVFLSYSHRQSAEAKQLMSALIDKHPDIRIFFDNNELTTGDKWQMTLYKSINMSRCVIVLLSHSYIESHVCNEELNLACARRLITKDSPEIVVVCLEEVDRKLSLFSFVDNVQYATASGSSDKLFQKVALSVDRWLTTEAKDAVFANCKVNFDWTLLNNLKRQSAFDTDYTLDSSGFVRHVVLQSSTDTTRSSSSSSPAVNNVSSSGDSVVTNEQALDVFLSYAAQDQQFARFLSFELRRRTIFVVDESTTQDPERIDHAQCVVVLLSMNYLKSLRKIDELNLALSRARTGRSVYFIAVENLPASETMTYVQLIECAVVVSDEIWSKVEEVQFASEIEEIRQKVNVKYGKLSVPHVLALMKAACDITAICQKNSFYVKTSQSKGCLQSVTNLCFPTENSERDACEVPNNNNNQPVSLVHSSKPENGHTLPDGKSLIDANNVPEVHGGSSNSGNQGNKSKTCSVL